MTIASIQYALLDAAKTAVQALTMSGITLSTHVVIQQAPTDRGNFPGTPAIILAPIGSEKFADGTNASDDIGYPVGVGIIDAANFDQTSDPDKRQYWREQLIDLFIHNRLSVSLSHATLYDQSIEPMPVVDAAAWFGTSYYVSAFVVRCWVRKLRRAS